MSPQGPQSLVCRRKGQSLRGELLNRLPVRLPACRWQLQQGYICAGIATNHRSLRLLAGRKDHGDLIQSLDGVIDSDPNSFAPDSSAYSGTTTFED